MGFGFLLVFALVSAAYADHVAERAIAMIRRGIAEGTRDSMSQAKMDALMQRYDYNDSIGDIEDLDLGDCPNYPTCSTYRQRALWEARDGEVDLTIGLGKEVASDQAWGDGNMEIGAGDNDVGAGSYSLAEQHFKDAQSYFDDAKDLAGSLTDGAEREFVRTFVHYRDANDNIEEVKACETCYGD
jgi:hypothetical protein